MATINKETEKWLSDYHAARELQGKETLSEKDVKKQTRVLGTPGGVNTRKAIDYIERVLVPGVLTPRGVPRGFPKDWAAEFDASVRSGKYEPLAKVAEARRHALIFENCRDYRDVLTRRNDFRGKEHLAALIIFWLRAKYINLKMLYVNDEYKQRHDYFMSDGFSLLVWGLCHGFYDGYTVDEKGNLIRPQGKEPLNPEESLKDFSTNEQPTMSAKARD